MTQNAEYVPVPDDELEALIDADTLHLLPKKALIASIKDLAEALIRERAKPGEKVARLMEDNSGWMDGSGAPDA